MGTKDISNFVTDNQSFRKKVWHKKGLWNCSDYANAVSSLHRSDLQLSDIYLLLIKGEEIRSSKIAKPPLQMCNNSSLNYSNASERTDSMFSTQDKIFFTLEKLEKNMKWKTATVTVGQPGDFFCSETVFS